MARWQKGNYTPKNPDKYIGDPSKIVYRSSWERSFCEFLDNNINVLEWASEEVAIPYLKPTDNRVHKYYPDFYIKYRNKDGDIVQEIVEIKPKNQTYHTVRQSRARNPKTRLVENLTAAINKAKWLAASQWCQQRGIVFRILTEQDLFK